jgi:uncharacterized protein
MLLMNALAAMVKTPGLSPLKTRLAQTVGTELAQNLYEGCIQSISYTMAQWQKATNRSAYWAVAEPQAQHNPLWQGFPKLVQSSGGLGERMAGVLNHLVQVHGSGGLIGADSPQLPLPYLESIDTIWESGCTDVVLGPSQDGGFYLVATRKTIPLELWQQVTYSSPSTLQDFVQILKQNQFVVDDQSLPMLVDLDTHEDILPIAKILEQKIVHSHDAHVPKEFYGHFCRMLQAAHVAGE